MREEEVCDRELRLAGRARPGSRSPVLLRLPQLLPLTPPQVVQVLDEPEVESKRRAALDAVRTGEALVAPRR